MASMDHTARSCPSVCNEPKSKSTSSVSETLAAVSENRKRRRSSQPGRAEAALAIAVMESMLKNHRKAHTSDNVTVPLSLNPVQCIGLETAIDLLHHYADTLAPTRGG